LQDAHELTADQRAHAQERIAWLDSIARNILKELDHSFDIFVLKKTDAIKNISADRLEKVQHSGRNRVQPGLPRMVRNGSTEDRPMTLVNTAHGCSAPVSITSTTQAHRHSAANNDQLPY